MCSNEYLSGSIFCSCMLCSFATAVKFVFFCVNLCCCQWILVGLCLCSG